jgi:flagellar biogenesis protein FliO
VKRTLARLTRSALRVAVVAIIAASEAAFAQRIGQGTGNEVPVWRVLSVLALCLTLAIAAAFVLRRRLAGPRPLTFGSERRLKLIEALRLSHQTDLCLVACDGGEFLVASTPHGATLVGPAPVAKEGQ